VGTNPRTAGITDRSVKIIVRSSHVGVALGGDSMEVEAASVAAHGGARGWLARMANWDGAQERSKEEVISQSG
jgi:ligand-binding sensor protein